MKHAGPVSGRSFDVSLAVLRFFDPALVAGDYIVVEGGVVRARR